MAQSADLEVFDEDIRLARKLLDQCLSFGLAQVHCHGSLVAIGAHIVSRFPRCVAVDVSKPGRSPCARIVTRSGTFDLDDVRPEIGQQLAGPWPREHSREVEDTQARKRSMLQGCGH
jgi:hypothetical protein